jgi:hypothetical protein
MDSKIKPITLDPLSSKDIESIKHMTFGGYEPGYGAVPPSSTPGHVTVTNTGINAAPVYTIGTGTGFTNPWNIETTLKSAQLELKGKDADVIINGKSLNQTIQALEQRLNILIPNPELETEWAELKQLGDAYRKLETDLTEKARMWQALKKTT